MLMAILWQHLLHISAQLINFVYTAGLDENSDGSLNTASVYGYADENSIEADLQPENKQY